ncbi:MAG: thioredoxin domain-containing protein [Nitrospirota bacterium]
MKRTLSKLLSGLIIAVIIFIPFLHSLAAEGTPSGKDAMKHQNRLINEKSPYLLQHAGNPVDWYSWGPEAFEKARKENKPIFLSIGYSTCHWCHEMEKESFEDPDVARLMNDVFVSIKVDREERPDIDHIYMTIAQMMTGSGGWPLTIIMTPDKKPFFSATYLPKESRFGLIGMKELTARIRDIWKDQKEKAIESADRITQSLERLTPTSTGEELGKNDLNAAYNELTQRFDRDNGGFGSSPKFPIPQDILFLLRYWKRTGDENALEMAEKTLRAMRNGGIYDHIGFGFHRYSTDSKWLVPHFEKMLYDQALLAMAYTEAYQATGKTEYSRTAREIFTYVMRDMTSKNGGFYSAEDADSEGEEGKFYLWTENEIRKLLLKEEAGLVINAYNIAGSGNFTEKGLGPEKKSNRNIFYLKKPLRNIASDLGISEEKLGKQIEAARNKIFKARKKRIHPNKDDKVLTDWNGLMIAALAKGAQAFNEPTYAEAARHAAGFILKTLRQKDGRILHRYRDGHAAVQAYADDYAFLIWGLIELYEATFDLSYLKSALSLNTTLLRHFWDNSHGGFFFSADDSESMLIRNKEFYDGAVPSGNSAAILNLLRLARITADPQLEKKAASLMRAFSTTVRQRPSAHTLMMSGVDFGTGPSHEVVITGDLKAADTKAMLSAIRRKFLPNKVVIFKPIGQNASEITDIASFTKYHVSIDGKATAYVCIDYNCKLPTTDLKKMMELLGTPRELK